MHFDKQTLLEAIHVPYTDLYWSEMEERGESHPPGAELCSITEHGPEDELLPIANEYLKAIGEHWGVPVVEVFKRAGWLDDGTDVSLRLYRLFMNSLGHGIGLWDEPADEETLQRLGKELGVDLIDTPYICDGRLWDVVLDQLEQPA
jgi:hypothetical protein